ncbi:MAG: WecB/TagA/CpsF family glycosyltransferase [Leptospiraceae bacterium]|nr:WecB/TagA/CpsF family glycosyltransferase [Leptospiraceae bacterium]MCP5512151.1 WecB/TagA/CpsF family glycosyltransferase [Leptospiraceae bacterium]
MRTCITGKVSRAPNRIRKIGMEWLFRLYAESLRLWKRYPKELTYFILYFIPLILFYTIYRFQSKISGNEQKLITCHDRKNMMLAGWNDSSFREKISESYSKNESVLRVK